MDVRFSRCLLILVLSAGPVHSIPSQEPSHRLWLPEQKCLAIRDPKQLSKVAPPLTPRPATISDPQSSLPARTFTLSEAINLALENSEVVRLLSGVTARTSGRTIYDAAITNTEIDQRRATFDPNLRSDQSWTRGEDPFEFIDPLDPSQALIGRSDSNDFLWDFGLAKRNQLGGTSELLLRSDEDRGRSTVLNPRERSSTTLRYTQPLLAGAGRAANLVPIVLARINTETSYFRYKDAVQQSVQGVIEAYWALVFAKTDLWARKQQVAQSEFANLRTETAVEAGDANAGELAQTRLALENFRASLLVSRANVLQREAALLNILGLTPYQDERPVPVTPMFDERIEVDWEQLNLIAAEQRPDIIELKLILEADQQQRIQANNQARPTLDGVALYRWDGLQGIVPAGNRVRSGAGDFRDWELGINFSVPIGLRAERAALRQRDLIIQRDRANLQQGLHQMQHDLALSIRNLDQFFSQYERFQAVRQAARTNLEQQLQSYVAGIAQFIVVLQAIVDWGNAVSSEAQSLSQYNTELARLELLTGTILETHQIVFFEERFQAIGPLGRCADPHCYPRATRPTTTVDRYPDGGRPSEENFDLEDPVQRRGQPSTEERLDLDAPVEFEDVLPMEDDTSDEAIDKLLPPQRAAKTLSDLLKRGLSRLR